MKRIVIILMLCLLITGCEQQEEKPKYQILNAGTDVYRLNTTSGEIVVFGRDGIQRYDDEYIRQRYQQKSLLSDLKTDENKTFPESNGNMWTKLKFKWRNDKILFQYSFGPFSENMQKEFRNSSDFITLTFVDMDGFDVVSQRIKLDSLTEIVDETGKINHWQKEGEVSCSKDDYKLIETYSLGWSFNKKLKDAIAQHRENIKKERQENLAKAKRLVEEGKVLGKIEGNVIYIKNKDGFRKIEETEYDLISYIVNNTEFIRSAQAENDRNEQNETLPCQ